MSMYDRTSKYREQCKLLIKSITGFNETDEQFQVCLDFALSNLAYHSYVDVNSHNVKHKISRLHEKFLVHSDLQKAKALQSLSERLINIFDKKRGPQKETYYSILSLILHLSESTELPQPQAKVISSRSDSEESYFDWSRYLKEDDVNYSSLSDSSSEISLSEHGSATELPTSEDDSLEDLPDPVLVPPPRDDSGLGISPDSCSGASQQFHVQVLPSASSLSFSNAERNPSTFYPYWLAKYQKMYGNSPYNLKTVNFTKIWNVYMESKNVYHLIEKKVMVHERNIIKEILWMFCGVKDLLIAQWDGRKFLANFQIHLCNLTANTLGAVLSEYCDYATKGATLQNFMTGVLTEPTHHCLTYEAYIWSLQEQLLKIRQSVCELDKDLRKKTDIFTLSILRLKMKPIFNEIDVLHYMHFEVCSEIADIDEPFAKACKLLHVLWNLLLHKSIQEQSSASLKIILKIFLKTCKPYFAFMEELIILGQFKDPYGEFIVRRGEINATDESFWESGYSLRLLPRDIEQDFFLKTFLPDILSGGKSLEIMNIICSLLKKEPFRHDAVKGQMYEKFLQVLQRLICRKNQAMAVAKGQTSSDNDKESSQCSDPLLHAMVGDSALFQFSTETAKFFRPAVNPAYRRISYKDRESLFPEEYKNTERMIEEMDPCSLKPLTWSIMKALHTCMQFAYYPVCRRLLSCLREEHNIMLPLTVMRKYFLMESGDLMFSFYSGVFEKIFYKQPWLDVSFLYSALQNAISEDEENSEKLCIFLNMENSEINVQQPLTHLNALQLSYGVDWPVSIMLGPKVQTEYCQIFSFLLQIKCAKYLLDDLYNISLSKYSQKQSRNQLLKAMLKSKLPREQKIHGMYIIRMRLMFFVNGLHNYIMTRILHSFGSEFTEILENCKTVDEMLSAHATYLRSLHERCLLDRRFSYLKEHIFQVLQLCQTFQQLWMKGVDRVSLEDLQNIENQFSKYSNFLLCCFNTPLRRGTYLSLESLVSTMLSSTHSFHIF